MQKERLPQRFLKRLWESLTQKQKLRLLVLLFYHYDRELYRKVCKAMQNRYLKTGEKPKQIVLYIKKRFSLPYKFYPILLYMVQRVVHNTKRRKGKDFEVEPSFKRHAPHSEITKTFLETFSTYTQKGKEAFLSHLLLLYMGNRYLEIEKRMESFFIKNPDREVGEVADTLLEVLGVNRDMRPLFLKLASKAKKRVKRRIAYALGEGKSL